MRRLSIAIMLLATSATALTATNEEAAALFAAQRWQEAAAAYGEIVAGQPANAFAWFRLARARAALGDAAGAYAALESWIATGSTSYQAAMAVPELASIRGEDRFAALIGPLKPCIASEYRQFDFWVGDWDVSSPAAPGTTSRNRITLINDGCTLHEQYTTPGGYAGSSLNFYDAGRKAWHQTWIDNQGGPLYLEGGLEGSSMVLSTRGDPQNMQRITWTPLPDGRVRQQWESTSDGGSSWSTVFDGYYSRRTEP